MDSWIIQQKKTQNNLGGDPGEASKDAKEQLFLLRLHSVSCFSWMRCNRSCPTCRSASWEGACLFQTTEKFFAALPHFNFTFAKNFSSSVPGKTRWRRQFWGSMKLSNPRIGTTGEAERQKICVRCLFHGQKLNACNYQNKEAVSRF